MSTPNERREAPTPTAGPAPAEVFHGDEVDETFDGRLKQAIVRHFRFEWRELIALRSTLRAEKSACARDTDSSGDAAPAAEPLDPGEAGPSAPGAAA